MEIIIDIIQGILILVGVFSFIYWASYFVELAKRKVRRKMKVCDGCFDFIDRATKK